MKQYVFVAKVRTESGDEHIETVFNPNCEIIGFYKKKPSKSIKITIYRSWD